MVEGVGSDSFLFIFYSFANLIVLRQIPGLQPKTSKRNKQGDSNLKNRTRPGLVERILAQRARHSGISANNQELSQCSEHPMDADELNVEVEDDEARRREAEIKQLADQQPAAAAKRQVRLFPHFIS
jgi:hypothetical protein